ncbi:MAG: RNA polymerase sigma factor [Myxococcota bacterium]
MQHGIDQDDHRSRTRALVSRARRGDRAASETLYRRFHDRIFRQAYMLVHEPDIAEDLTQETFARALSRLHEYDPTRAEFSTWLYGIVVNLSREHWRRAERGSRLLDRLRSVLGRDTAPNPERELSRGQQFDALDAAVARLPPPLREALVLVDLQHLSPEEAGSRLGISPGNVRVRTHRARRRLRAMLRTHEHGGEQ